MGSSPLTRGKRRRRSRARPDRRLIPAHAGKTHTERTKTHAYRAHPRSRGENVAPCPCLTSWRGSSPLTRGKRPCSRTVPTPGRLIPAHAGKTPARGVQALLRGAHPRSRGENAVQKVEDGSDEGSSPLTRGKLLVAVRACDHDGLIPAHAGKTGRRRFRRRRKRAHPRSRGENGSLD